MARRPTKLKETLVGFGRVVARFSPYMGPHKGLVAGGIAAVLAQVFLRILEPWPLKVVFDYVLTDGAGGIAVPFVDGRPVNQVLGLAALALVTFVGLTALAKYLATVAFALVGNRVVTAVRQDLYAHLQRLSMAYHRNARGGDLTVRVVGDIGMLKEVAVTAALPMAANTLVLVGMLSVMLWIDWRLALVAFSVLPLFLATSLQLGGRIHQVAREQRQREGALASTTAESMAAIHEVQALNAKDTFAAKFADANERSLKEGVKGKRLAARLERTVDVLVALSTGLVLVYGARLVLDGQMSPGDLLVFLAYLKTSFRPMRDSAKYTARLAKATAAGERVLEILETDVTVADAPDAKPAPPFRGDLQFSDVHFAYGEQPVLQGVNLQVPAGSSIAVLGPSGTGKSTMVSMLLRFQDPDQGVVTIDGHDIREFQQDSLRASLGIVQQDLMLFTTTLAENISFGMTGVTQEQIEDAARRAQAHDFIMAFPEGYDTIPGERGATLSHGQRQRIAMARAYVRDARILLLDEPTTGLDAASEGEVRAGLRHLMQGRTTLIVTHDERLAELAGRVVHLEAGQIREGGTIP